MRISDWSSDVCSSDLKQSPVAQEALERIAALYAVEKAIRGRPPDERHQVRQECSRPVAEDLFAWMESTLPELSGRSDLAAAIRYALARRENLTRYLDDGCLAIDKQPARTGARSVGKACVSTGIYRASADPEKK